MRISLNIRVLVRYYQLCAATSRAVILEIPACQAAFFWLRGASSAELFSGAISINVSVRSVMSLVVQFSFTCFKFFRCGQMGVFDDKIFQPGYQVK